MKYLFLDTSAFFINSHIIVDDKIVSEMKIKVEKDMSNKIIPLISAQFNSQQFKISELDKIFVTNGPGSFTGIRVGLTVAKVVATSFNIPLVLISSLEYLSSIDTTYKKIIPIIDARRGNVYTAIYDSDLNLIEEEKLRAFDLINIDEESILTSYDGFNNSNVSNVDIIKLIKKHKNDKGVDAHKADANYLKKTEAEEKLNDKKNC